MEIKLRKVLDSFFTIVWRIGMGLAHWVERVGLDNYGRLVNLEQDREGERYDLDNLDR